MSWRGLRYKARERLLSKEWNAVVDALNDLYGFLTSGQQDIFVDEVYGRTAHFTERIDCEGRPVILDGDPISIYQLYDIAKSQITEAIDATKSKATLDAIYGNLLPKVDLLSDYVRETRDVVVKLRMDEYGNVGVIIAEPLDEYGRVKTAPPSELLDELKTASNTKSIIASENTTGLEVVLFKGGRPNVNAFYSLGGAGNVYVEVSIDGVTWRPLDTISLSASGSGIKTYYSIAYPYIRARTDVTGIDVTLELVASR
jgi:hypothetical protein